MAIGLDIALCHSELDIIIEPNYTNRLSRWKKYYGIILIGIKMIILCDGDDNYYVN